MAGSRRFFIDGPAGKLQALWTPADTPANKAAVVCHPHPLYGGTMENKVVARCARYLSQAGVDTFRFNFRGVDESEGTFDSGRGERDDVRAMIDYVVETLPAASLAVVGFSFGSWVGTASGAEHDAVRALVAIAPVVTKADFDRLKNSAKPKLIVYAGQDQYTDPASIEAWIAQAQAPVESFLVPGVDHFFGERVNEAARKVADFVAGHL